MDADQLYIDNKVDDVEKKVDDGKKSKKKAKTEAGAAGGGAGADDGSDSDDDSDSDTEAVKQIESGLRTRCAFTKTVLSKAVAAVQKGLSAADAQASMESLRGELHTANRRLEGEVAALRHKEMQHARRVQEMEVEVRRSDVERHRAARELDRTLSAQQAAQGGGSGAGAAADSWLAPGQTALQEGVGIGAGGRPSLIAAKGAGGVVCLDRADPGGATGGAGGAYMCSGCGQTSTTGGGACGGGGGAGAGTPLAGAAEEGEDAKARLESRLVEIKKLRGEMEKQTLAFAAERAALLTEARFRQSPFLAKYQQKISELENRCKGTVAAMHRLVGR